MTCMQSLKMQFTARAEKTKTFQTCQEAAPKTSPIYVEHSRERNRREDRCNKSWKKRKKRKHFDPITISPQSNVNEVGKACIMKTNICSMDNINYHNVNHVSIHSFIFKALINDG